MEIVNKLKYQICLYDSIHDFSKNLDIDDHVSYKNKKFYYFKELIFNYLNQSLGFEDHYSLNQGRMVFHDRTVFKTDLTVPTSNIEDIVLFNTLNIKKNFIRTTDINKINYQMPLIIDTQSKLLKFLNDPNKYFLCINQELICDPGSKISYNDPKRFTLFIEKSGQKRLYKKNELPGYFDILMEGLEQTNENNQSTKINYFYNNNLIDKYNLTLNNHIKYNTVEIITNNILELININDIYYTDINISNAYNSFFKNKDINTGINFYKTSNNIKNNINKISQYSFNIIKEFSKKRYGDQLQVLSCLKSIKYKNINNNKIYTVINPYFVSIDRMAIAFAIINNINCIYDIKDSDNFEIYTFNKPTIIEDMNQTSDTLYKPITPILAKKGGFIDLLTEDKITNNPYNILNLVLPIYYDKILNFKANILRKNSKRFLRPIINDQYIFTDDLFDIYNIFIYNSQNDSILYYLDNKLYYKELNMDDMNKLLTSKNINDIKNIINTKIKFDLNFKKITNLYNKNNIHDDDILNNLFRHELKSNIDSEYRESYFENVYINENYNDNIPIYLPLHLELYFIVNELYNPFTKIDINNKELSDDIKEYLNNAKLSYSVIINKNIENLNINNEIIIKSYNKYKLFFNNIKKINNNLDKIKLYILNNLHMNTYKNIYYSLNNTPIKLTRTRKNNINFKKNITVKGGKKAK
jgi:hypothetical protein